MSMTEEVAEKAKPAKKKRAVRRNKVASVPRAAAKEKTPNIYAGMTVKDCCIDCNAERCVISGKPYCAHPRKGGLHPVEMGDQAALRRRKEAENILRNQMLKAPE